MRLPLGAPEGSVRALITLFIVVFGFVVLALQNDLGINNANAIAGFVGTVIAFYFASRSGDAAQKAAELAHDASTDTTTTVAGAIKSATTAATDAQHATAQKVSDTSGTAVKNAADATQVALKAVNPQTPPSPGTGGAPAQSTTDLQNLSDQLTSMQTIARAATALGTGAADLLPNAASTLTTLNDLATKVQPLLKGNADPASVQDAVSTVTKQLPALQSAGLPGALGSALAVFKQLSGPAATIVAGLPGGPVGLIAGVITAGIQLVTDRQRYAPYKTAMLNQPFDPASMPAAPDDTLAKSALSNAPLMLAHYTPPSAPAASALLAFTMQKVQGTTLSPADLAAKAWGVAGPAHQAADGPPLPPPDPNFTSLADTTTAFDEYIAAIVFQSASARINATLPLPSVAGIPQGATIDLSTLANAARLVLPDPQASAELERLVYLAEALGRLPMHPDQIASVAASALSAALTTPVAAASDNPAHMNGAQP
ncbi:hypothetical protein [Paraburkholderia sp. EB58]|uniref:hypothetical protein n=1 Tax=Paraburkholderia sp. EB58 TaxID=3035125 RepID=UPI003D1D0E58